MAFNSNPGKSNNRVRFGDLNKEVKSDGGEAAADIPKAIPPLATPELKVESMTDREVQQTLKPLVGAGIIKDLAAIPRVISQNYRKEAHLMTGKTFTNHQSWGSIRADKTAYVSLFHAANTHLTKPLRDLQGGKLTEGQVGAFLVKAQQTCDKYFVGGNTPKALFERFLSGLGKFKNKSGLTIKPPNHPRCSSSAELKAALTDTLEHLSVVTENLPDLSTKTLLELLEDVTINRQAHPGVPFGPGASKGVVSQDAALKEAQMVLEGLNSGNPGQWIADHPWCFLLLMKNKAEMAEVVDWNKKCRPYFIYPYGFQLLCSVVFQPLQKCLENFSVTTNEYCWNALGFSWIGGAQKLVKWIERIDPQWASALIYADDHLIKLWTKDKVIVAPFDIKSMDMSLSHRWEIYIAQYVVQCFGAKRLGPFLNVVRAWAKLMFTNNVLIKGGLAIQKNEGAASGTVAVSIAETIILTKEISDVTRLYKEYITKTKPDATPQEALSFWKTTFESRGYQLKDLGASEYQVFDRKDGQVVVPSFTKPSSFSFLGARIQEMKTSSGKVVFPVPVDPMKCVASYVRPSVQYKAGMDDGKVMARCLGLAVSGGFLHPVLFKALQTRWNKMRDQGVIPAQEHLSESELMELSLPVKGVPDFPSRSRIIEFLGGIKPLFDEKAETKVAPTLVPKKKKESKDDKPKSVFDFAKLEGDWGDMEDTGEEVADMQVTHVPETKIDKGMVVNLDDLPLEVKDLPAGKLGQLNPDPKKEAKRQARKALNIQGKPGKAKGKKGDKGFATLESLEEQDQQETEDALEALAAETEEQMLADLDADDQPEEAENPEDEQDPVHHESDNESGPDRVSDVDETED